MSVLRNSLVVVGSTLLGLGIAELAVRGLGLAPPVHRILTGEDDLPYIRSANPVLGYEMIPNFRRDPAAQRGQPGADFHCDRTNSHGLRDIERSLDRFPDRRRILLVGDSVVAGHGLWDVEETIPRRMEALFPGGGTEVLNFGTGGYNTRAEAELVRVRGVRFHPDLVVVIALENDFEQYNGQIEKYAYRRPRIVEAMFLKSHLFRQVSLLTDLFHFREQLSPQRYRIEANAKSMKSEFLTSVESGLQLLHRLGSEHGFEVVLFVWPEFRMDGITDEPFYAAFAELADPYGIRVLPLAPHFREDYRRRVGSMGGGRPVPPPFVYTVGDGMHPGPLGATVAAQAIVEAIRSERLLDR
jgi:lysophospholipase L1-like esterase